MPKVTFKKWHRWCSHHHQLWSNCLKTTLDSGLPVRPDTHWVSDHSRQHDGGYIMCCHVRIYEQAGLWCQDLCRCQTVGNPQCNMDVRHTHIPHTHIPHHLHSVLLSTLWQTKSILWPAISLLSRQIPHTWLKVYSVIFVIVTFAACLNSKIV